MTTSLMSSALASDANQGTVDPGPVLDLLNGFRKSKTLFAAVELGIFDTLATSTGRTTDDVANQYKAAKGNDISVDGLERLLNACTALDLLSKDQHGRYSLTPLSQQYLTTSSPSSLTGYVVHSNKVVYPLFGGLEKAVIKGSNVWQEQVGFGGSEIFKHIYSTPADVLRFMAGMHSFAQLSARHVLTAFDLSQYSRMVDLGGATGALMVTAAELYPQARACVVDLPHVIQAAQEHFLQPPFVTNPAVLDRVDWVTADFFAEESKVPPADLYVLSRILHDWEESKCMALLQLVACKLQPGGALLVCEMLLEEDCCGPAPALLQSLNMLCQTNGKERSVSQYRQLLTAAGFSKVEGKRTGSYLDAVIACK